MKKKPYNGWFNRATWNVALWIGNDEGLYNSARDRVRQHKGSLTGVEARDLCSELFNGTKTPDGDSLYDVHWPEIARSLKEMFL